MVLTEEERASRPMTVKDAAQYLQLSEPTLLKLLKEGSIPARKVGRQWRILRSALDEYIAGKPASKD